MAFHHNDNLTNVIIPDSIIYIGKNAFLDCDNLTRTEYGNGYYIGTEENPYFALINLKENATTCNIHNQTKIIKESIFERNKNLTNVIIGNSILSIENHTFDSCYNLTSVTIGNSVISIGEEAFDGCDSLTSVTFENTEGWWRSTSSTATSGTSISATALADPSTAATYLMYADYNYYWKRTVAE